MHDAKQISEHLWRPRRAALERVRRTAAEALSPQQLWAKLTRHDARLSVTDAAERCYGVIDTTRSRPTEDEPPACDASPPTTDAVITFASDLAGLSDAERALRRVVDALTPWGCVPARRIEWFSLSHRRPLTFYLGPAHDCALDSLDYALEGGIEWEHLAEPARGVPRLALDHLRGARGWAIAASEGLGVPRAHGAPTPIVGRHFSELLDPFTPLLDFWMSGYHLAKLPSSDDPSARCYAFSWNAQVAPPYRHKGDIPSH